MKDAMDDSSSEESQWRLPNITMGIYFYFVHNEKIARGKFLTEFYFIIFASRN
jgi:hypothetical protein